MKVNSMRFPLNISILKTSQLIGLLTCVVLSLLGSQDCAAQSKSKSANPRVPATVQGYESAMLYAKVGGYLKSVNVNIGDEVAAGDVLAEIDVPEMALQLAQKESLLALAKAKSDQSAARIEEAMSKLDSLKAGVAEAESTRSAKRALCNFERTECERLARLAASGSVQSSLVDAARYKLQSAQAELKSVDAKIATAKANLAGGDSAVRRSKADAAAAEAQVKVSQADIDYTKELMKYATIRAPWAGTITGRMVDTGAFVQSAEGNSAAKPMFTLVRDDKVRVTFSLSAKDIGKIKKGLRVTLGEIDALPGKTFEGEVTRFSSALDAKTRMLRVEMDLDNEGELAMDNSDSPVRLKPGFFGYATVHVNE